MEMETFEAAVARERQRLEEASRNVQERRSKLDDELAIIEQELAAIAAYEVTRRGKAGGTAARKPRGDRRRKIVELIQDAADGLTRGEIIEALELRGNKSGEQSISNALNALKKANSIGAKDGRYVAA